MVSSYSERKRLIVCTNPFLIAACLVAVLVYTNAVPVRERHPYRSLLPLEAAVSLEGTVRSNPVVCASGKSYSVVLAVDSVETQIQGSCASGSATGRVLCIIPAVFVESLYPGKLYSSSGKACIVESGSRLSVTGTYSRQQGAFVAEAAFFKGFGSGFRSAFLQLRATMRLAFKRLLFSWGEAGALILALLSGSREYTPPSLSDAFRTAGLSHLLALSGMHLSFFASVTGKTGEKLLGKRHSLFLRFLAVSAFVWFAGFTPSLYRAFLFSLLFMASSVLSVETEPLPVLAETFLLHSVTRPQDMKTPAFMLSYCAMAGMLLFASAAGRYTVRIFPPKLSASVASSFGAQSTTAPVSAVLFGTLAPAGIAASVCVSPLVSLFMTTACAAIALCLAMPFLSPLFGGILLLVYRGIELLVSFFASFPLITF